MFFLNLSLKPFVQGTIIYIYIMVVMIVVVVDMCDIIPVVDFNFEPSKGPVGKLTPL